MFNQYGQMMPDYSYQPRQLPQRYDVIRVNGKGGADAFQMAPNSSVLLLDTSAPVVWLKSTDGAGYPTCTPYSITPYQPDPPVNQTDLLARVERLEAILNAKSDSSNVKQSAE